MKRKNSLIKKHRLRAGLLLEALVKENAANALTCGDPVRLAIGSFYFSVTGFSCGFLNRTIEIKRIYQTQTSNKHSPGYGWNFNYDTRIINELLGNLFLPLKSRKIPRMKANSVNIKKNSKNHLLQNNKLKVRKLSWILRNKGLKKMEKLRCRF